MFDKWFLFVYELNLQKSCPVNISTLLRICTKLPNLTLTLTVTICLSYSVSEIWSVKELCLIRLIRLIAVIRSMSETTGLYSCRVLDRIQKKKKMSSQVIMVTKFDCDLLNSSRSNVIK